mmetsp:Transcript_14749/g.44277  ORF Transcript_14749/g.44277 Transcript_14749/m.44277 type:complete len:279 (+) Transcript_14749:478-1314(+)
MSSCRHSSTAAVARASPLVATPASAWIADLLTSARWCRACSITAVHTASSPRAAREGSVLAAAHRTPSSSSPSRSTSAAEALAAEAQPCSTSWASASMAAHLTRALWCCRHSRTASTTCSSPSACPPWPASRGSAAAAARRTPSLSSSRRSSTARTASRSPSAATRENAPIAAHRTFESASSRMCETSVEHTFVSPLQATRARTSAAVCRTSSSGSSARRRATESIATWLPSAVTPASASIAAHLTRQLSCVRRTSTASTTVLSPGRSAPASSPGGAS